MRASNELPPRRWVGLMPADRTLLREIAEVAGEEPWSPSILHTLTVCPSCGRDCWIGPEQVKLLNLNSLISIRVACAVCITKEAAHLSQTFNNLLRGHVRLVLVVGILVVLPSIWNFMRGTLSRAKYLGG